MFNLKTFLGLNYYTSDLDQFLTAYDHRHPTPTASVLQEINKYKQIAAQRDNPNATPPAPNFWDKF